MILTTRQEEGLRLTLANFANTKNKPYTVIAGYAGSGKSTLVNVIVQELVAEYDLQPDLAIVFACFTGKAAQVLIDKGNSNAMTLHKLLYKAEQNKDGSFSYYRKQLTDFAGIRLIIVDECSMVPNTMVQELLHIAHTLGIHIIFLGDPGQLPPIRKDDDNGLLEHPDVFLDEIMRQAQDSGIIRLSMLIREGKPLDNFTSDDAKVFPKSQFVDGMLSWSDINICALNNTRIALNKQTRELLGYQGDICEKDKIICLRNYWDIYSQNGNALTNGVIGTIHNIASDKVYYPYWVGEHTQINVIKAGFISETGDNFGRLCMDSQCILTGTPACSPKEKYQINGRRGKALDLIDPIECTYGYAITCHKAQGSQWDKVLVLEEKFPYDKEEHKRWLYTACTRAASRLVLVR